MTKVLQVPAYLLDSVAAHARTQHPREACGFLCGPKRGQPERFVPIPNVHAQPERYYRMDPESVLAAFAVMDELKQDVLAVYHSHTRTGHEMSESDINEAMDLDAVYLICSTATSVNLPTFAAWTIEEERVEALVVPGTDSFADPATDISQVRFIPRRAREVALDIIDDAHPDSPLVGLVEGNRVRLVYDGEGGRRTVVATVGKRAENGKSVTLQPARSTPSGAPLVIGIDRIRKVGILTEGTNAARIRARAVSHLQEAAIRLAAVDTVGARGAIERAGALMPRLIPQPPAVARAYRPRRRTE